MANAMNVALVETCQHLLKQKLRKKYEVGGSGSLFPSVEEYPQELLFSAIEFEELGEGFGGDDGNSGDEFPEERDLLTMTASSEVETREFAVELPVLESKLLMFLSLFPFAFICSLIWLHDAKILPFASVPLSQVAEKQELPLARPVSIKWKKLVANLSYPCIYFLL